jgi:hypothetical protein
MLRLAAIASAFAVMTGVAAAAEVPTIPIERTCRAAKPLDAQDTQPVETCLRDERAARSELQGEWARFAESQRRLCVEQTNTGGFPSYVEVLTCLEMYGPAPSAPVRRARRQFGQ